MNKKQMINKLWFVYIGLLMTFLLFTNIKTPLMGEDYGFILNKNNKILLIKQIYNNIINIFFPNHESWNIRIGETLTSLWLNLGYFLGVGKTLFSILNAIVAFLFFIIIYFWTNCRLPNIDNINDLFLFSSIPILFLICSFSLGEIFFWCDGSTNYLWSGTILLGVALPYRKYLNDLNYKMKNNKIFGYMIVSYIAGFTNENTVPIIILLGVFLLFRDIVMERYKNIPAWLIYSILSMGAGYSILLFSPSTKKRTIVYRNMFNLPEKMSIDELNNNFINVVSSFISSNYMYLLFLFLGFICLLIIIYINSKKNEIGNVSHNFLLDIKSNIFIENILLFTISIISIIALFFSPYTEPRSFLFIQVFIIILIIQLNSMLLYTSFSGIKKYIIYLPNICFSFISIFFIFQLSFWTLDYSKFDRLRSESIKKQIEEGKKFIIAKKYKIESNRYLNTRESWIRDTEYGGEYCYKKYHTIENITWRMSSYEEEAMELKYISKVIIPQNISEIMTYDIISKEYNDENIIFECGTYDPQIYLTLSEPINKPFNNIFLEIKYFNNKEGLLQVFYDYGSGLSEENSVRVNIEESLEISNIRLPIICLRDGNKLVSIRIDPPDGTIFKFVSVDVGEMVEK